MAEFKSPEALLEAARRARAAGFEKIEAYSPFPVEGLDQAVGMRRNWVAFIVFLAGLAGGVGGFYMQWYSAVLSYPINSGGRPLNSWPEFIPATFELIILCAALAGFVGMLLMNGLPRLYHPVFNVPEFELASRNRFFLCLRSAPPQSARDFLAALAPMRIWEVPE
jgi:hypothetical protein